MCTCACTCTCAFACRSVEHEAIYDVDDESGLVLIGMKNAAHGTPPVWVHKDDLASHGAWLELMAYRQGSASTRLVAVQTPPHQISTSTRLALLGRAFV